MLANNNQGGMPWPHTSDILSTFCKQLQPVAPATTLIYWGGFQNKKIGIFVDKQNTSRNNYIFKLKVPSYL